MDAVEKLQGFAVSGTDPVLWCAADSNKGQRPRQNLSQCIKRIGEMPKMQV